MTCRLGSAAGATRALPQSAVRSAVEGCIDHLGHTLDLARIAVRGPEPEQAARYIIDTLDDLRAELRVLRLTLKNTN